MESGEGEGARKAVKVSISSNEPHHHPLPKVDSTRKTVFKIHSFKTLKMLRNLEKLGNQRGPALKEKLRFNPAVRVYNNLLSEVMKSTNVLTFQLS